MALVLIAVTVLPLSGAGHVTVTSQEVPCPFGHRQALFCCSTVPIIDAVLLCCDHLAGAQPLPVEGAPLHAAGSAVLRDRTADLALGGDGSCPEQQDLAVLGSLTEHGTGEGHDVEGCARLIVVHALQRAAARRVDRRVGHLPKCGL
jgi:hypothetical protein